MSSTPPTGLDTLLQKVMDPNTQSELLENLKNLTTSKRPRNKRKEKQSKSSEKPLYHLPKVDDNSTEQSASLPTNEEPEAKRKRLDERETLRHKYHSPTQAPKNFKEAKPDQTDTIQYRRSPRVPRVVAKYLGSIKAELNDSDDE